MTIILTSNQSCNSLLDKNRVQFRILRYNRKERVAYKRQRSELLMPSHIFDKELVLHCSEQVINMLSPETEEHREWIKKGFFYIDKETCLMSSRKEYLFRRLLRT